MRSVINFGRNVRFTPRHFYEPATDQEVLDILDSHAAGKVRIVGALHAWSPGVVCEDAVINLRHFDGVTIERGPDQSWATVGGGCRIRTLLSRLRRAGLTLPSVGLITEQTIAGAISTATHGSGRHSLSHYVDAAPLAAFDSVTGKARIYELHDGDALRAARCAIGCMGVILSVRIRCVQRYDVAETINACATLDEVLAGEKEYPLQQFYLLPHRWTYFVQRREAQGPQSPGFLRALYRIWWFFAIDVALHWAIVFLAAMLSIPLLVRLFYRYVLPPLILRNVTVVDDADRMLVMRHDLFRHLETEIFVPEKHLRAAVELVRGVLEVFDGGDVPAALAADLERIGMLDELRRCRGSFTHHYPIAIRRVLPDDALIATSSGDEPYYAISCITYTLPRRPFLRT